MPNRINLNMCCCACGVSEIPTYHGLDSAGPAGDFNWRDQCQLKCETDGDGNFTVEHKKTPTKSRGYLCGVLHYLYKVT